MADPAIRLRSLSFAYPKGPRVLEEVSLDLAPGESVGLVGPNGAGKTTLFLCLAGVLPVMPGQVNLAGLDPADPRQRRQLPGQVSIVFQNSDDQLFNTTVFDDVAFGPLNLGLAPEEVRQRVVEALRQVGMIDCQERVPFHLSGGEKRRVALAGVLAMLPAVLLLDEPSSSLDPRGRRELIRIINSLAVTKLIAAHDLEMILQTCTRAVILDRGRVQADGPVREVFGNAALMETHGLEVPHSLTPHRDQHHQEGRGARGEGRGMRDEG
jgi:cobalt/nickel transport system ATP-binding protein